MNAIYQQLITLTDEEKRILNDRNLDVDRTVYTDQQDFIIERAKFLTDNKLIVTRKHPRFIAFPAHRHDYIELNYVYHGFLKQRIGNEWFELKKGELLFLNQHIEHELAPCSKDDLIINFIIDPKFFEQMFQNLAVDGVEQSVINFLISSSFNHDFAGHYLYFKVSDVTEIQAILEKMIKEMMEPTVFSEVSAKFHLGLLIVELMKHADQVVTKSPRIHDHRIILDVLRYIDESFKDARLEQLATDLGMTSYNLSKQIKKTTNQTFKGLLQERRLQEAALLLTHTQLSIEQIATVIGYENVSYFYRIFKRKYKDTPKNYRMKTRSKSEFTF